MAYEMNTSVKSVQTVTMIWPPQPVSPPNTHTHKRSFHVIRRLPSHTHSFTPGDRSCFKMIYLDFIFQYLKVRNIYSPSSLKNKKTVLLVKCLLMQWRCSWQSGAHDSKQPLRLAKASPKNPSQFTERLQPRPLSAVCLRKGKMMFYGPSGGLAFSLITLLFDWFMCHLIYESVLRTRGTECTKSNASSQDLTS